MREVKKLTINNKSYSYVVINEKENYQAKTAYYAIVNLNREVLSQLKGELFAYGFLGLDLHDRGTEHLPEGCTSIVVLHYSTSQSHMNVKLLYMDNSNEVLDVKTIDEIQQGFSLQRVFHKLDQIEVGNCLKLLNIPVIAEQLTDYFSIEEPNNIYNLTVGGKFLQPNSSFKVSDISSAIRDNQKYINSLDSSIVETLGISEVYVKLYNRIHRSYLVGEFTFLDKFGELVENWQIQYLQENKNLTKIEIENIHTYREEYIQNSFKQYEKDYLEQIEVHKGIRDNYYNRLLDRHKKERALIKEEEREYLTKPVTVFFDLSFLEFLIEQGRVSFIKH